MPSSSTWNGMNGKAKKKEPTLSAWIPTMIHKVVRHRIMRAFAHLRRHLLEESYHDRDPLVSRIVPGRRRRARGNVEGRARPIGDHTHQARHVGDRRGDGLRFRATRGLFRKAGYRR